MNLDTQPFYEQLELFVRLPDAQFRTLCKTNKAFHSICSGNLTPDILERFGPGVTEELYKRRFFYFYDQKFLKYKEEMSWKEFYNKLAYVYHLIDTVPDVQDYFGLKSLVEENRLTELKILQDIVKNKERSIVAIAISAISGNGNLDILKWVTSLNWDQEKIKEEIHDVIGNFDTLSEAIFNSFEQLPNIDIYTYIIELRDSGK